MIICYYHETRELTIKSHNYGTKTIKTKRPMDHNTYLRNQFLARHKLEESMIIPLHWIKYKKHINISNLEKFFNTNDDLKGL